MDAATVTTAYDEATDTTSTLLLVDDEENILAALRRMFKRQGYRLFTAGSGPAGLEVLERESIDMVISDMRMPGMDGAKFLERVAQQWPATIRILLTGYADLSLTIDAINKGHIYRYISKPWEDNDIKLTVQHALETQSLEREKRRLEDLTRRQNEELKALNGSLEYKVKARTAELQQMYDMLMLTYKELKRSYVASIPVFSSLIELQEGEPNGHSKRTAEMARLVAREMTLDDGEAEKVYFAGLLHDIGLLGMSGKLLSIPYVKMSTEERKRFEKHPAAGQAALMAMESLQGVATVIRHHHERYDGKGYPDHLFGDHIPLGARILAVVDDFDALQLGDLLGERLSETEALHFIRYNRNQRYDPGVADAFLNVVSRDSYAFNHIQALKITSNDLRAGMVLARDLYNDDGILLLSSGYRLNDSVIEKIKSFESDEDKGLVIHIRAE